MKNKNKVIGIFTIVIFCAVFNSSCTNDYAEINRNKYGIATIGSAEIPFLFTQAQHAVNWNGQVEQNLFADQYAQYVANNAPYFPSDRYVIENDWVFSHWANLFTGIVPQLQTIFEKTDPASAEYAVANIWWVYAFHRVTDYWGPIPYSKAGIPGTSVAYDSQESIYADFFVRLDNAITVLEGKRAESPYGDFDIIYAGDVNKWIKFANTLRLRLALRISNVDAAKAKTEAEAAVNAGVLESSPEDDALAMNNIIDANQISRMSDWNEFRMSAAMESALKGYDDPRLPVYWIPAVNSGTFEGIRNGLSVEQLVAEENTAPSNSHIGPRWSSPGSGGVSDYLSTPSNVMSAAESHFLRAEGALLGWNMGGTAKSFYESGIRQSMKQWGIDDETEVNNYLNSLATPISPDDYLESPAISSVPVKFDDADENVQLEQIALQKWIALFPDGIEAWADYRRRPVVGLYPVANSDNPDILDPTAEKIRRITFLIQEYQSNQTEVQEAVKLLKGQEDKISTPLWWDVN